MKILSVKNLQKSFDELDVIKDISLDVEEGQVVAVIGPSGSGKFHLSALHKSAGKGRWRHD
jgi:polar amino acid transport system ATP-binding protein